MPARCIVKVVATPQALFHTFAEGYSAMFISHAIQRRSQARATTALEGQLFFTVDTKRFGASTYAKRSIDKDGKTAERPKRLQRFVTDALSPASPADIQGGSPASGCQTAASEPSAANWQPPPAAS